MRISYQDVTISTSKRNTFYALLRKDFQLAARLDTEVVIRPLLKGWHDTDNWHSSASSERVRYFRLLNDMEVMEGMLQAEREGYDAIVIGCFWDPCLQEARGALNIPVVGAAESSLLMASLFGTRFAVVTFREEWIPSMTENILRMSDRIISSKPVRSLTLPEQQFDEKFEKPAPVIENFKTIAKGCIEDGADVVVAGCNSLSALLSANGVMEVSGVPIVDPIISTIKLAEVLVDLKQKNLSWVSRKGVYERPSKEDMDTIRSFYPYHGSGVTKML
jgi:allantoin racemase